MKRLISIILCGLLLISSSYCYAGSGPEHDDYLERILLGKTLSEPSKDPEQSGDHAAVLFGYLELASYLCIDQMGDQGQDKLDALNKFLNMESLPKSIQDFKVPTIDHEKYTHMGWDYKLYSKPKEWEIRKNILRAAVSKVFGIPIGSTECEEMAKLIYYIHVLGDHALNKYKSSTGRIELRNPTAIQGEKDKGLVNELRECVSKLFWNQRTSKKYAWLRVKLNTIRFRSWITGEEDSEKKHIKVQNIAEDALNYLYPQVRNLLLETSFYEVFK